MNQSHAFTVSLLDASAQGLAAAAASRLGGQGIGEFNGGSEFQSFSDHLKGRIAVLAEALHFGIPEVVAADARWNLESHRAREVGPELLVRALEALHDELEESLPAAAAAEAGEYLQHGLREYLRPPGSPPASYLESSARSETAREFLLACLEGHAREAEGILRAALEGGVGFAELHHEVILPVQSEVGRLWQGGQIHVGVEHLTSLVVERYLAAVRAHAPQVESLDRTVLVSSIQGNRHQIGGRILADQFERKGWTAIYLGADTPSTDLIDSVEHWKPDLVAISIGLWTHLRTTEQLILGLRALESPCKVLVGGRPLTKIPDLWKSLGADGSAGDAASAVALGTVLVDGPVDGLEPEAGE